MRIRQTADYSTTSLDYNLIRDPHIHIEIGSDADPHTVIIQNPPAAPNTEPYRIPNGGSMSTVAPSTAGYLPVVIFTLVGFAFVGFTLLFARLVRPSAPSREKSQTYECGVTPV